MADHPDGRASHRTDPQRACEGSFTYHHAGYDDGEHWFSAEYDGDEVGHAHVIERQGPGGPHAEIKRLWTNPHYRGRGIGSRLLDNVGEHFQGQELRLKPYPVDEDGHQDEADLRAFYRNRGFEDYQLKDGDPAELYDYMTKRAPPGPATAATGDPYQTGLCGTYAVALMRLRPDLRMGVAGDAKDDDESVVPDHYFAHDDHYAYDSTGRHLLPYSGRWRYSQLDAADPWVLDAEHESHEQAEEAIAGAQEHAMRHRVLEGGGPAAVAIDFPARPELTARQPGGALRTGSCPQHPRAGHRRRDHEPRAVTPTGRAIRGGAA